MADGKFKQQFKQQRLKAWQPILTADTVLPAFFLIGLIFVPLGVALLLISDSVLEFELDYTDCNSTKFTAVEPLMCRDVIDRAQFKHGEEECVCHLQLNVTQDMANNVYIYYALDNFYQNHRRYVKSRDDKQLSGQRVSSIGQDCSPFDVDEHGKIYAPAGAIANSLFNDSLVLTYNDKLTRIDRKVPVIATGIAWDSDKNIKFKNPSGSLDDSKGGAFENTVKPKYWTKSVFNLDTKKPSNNGYQNEDLIVWMRTAAFPNFKKLYRRVNHSEVAFKTGVPKGIYKLEVKYNYPVDKFGGRKKIVLSTTSFLGGKNSFLGIAYIAVGCICFILGVIFLVVHVKYGERTTNHLNIDQNTPYQN